MKKQFVKAAASCGLCLTLLAGGVSASAAYNVGVQNRMGGSQMFGQQTQMFGGRQGGASGQLQGQTQGGMFGQTQGQTQGGMFGGMQTGAAVSTAGSATEIVAGETTNSAAALEADTSSATTVTMTDENNEVKIKAAGTYIVTGACSDGSITVTKGTTGVVLVLKDLNLTSSEGAALSINKESEVKVIVSGSVTLTDAENPDDEYSSDADVADAYDGAAIKVKAGASAYITGTGTLTVNGSAKNGIKAGDETVLVIDGPTVNITAANDGINGNYDVAILSGKLIVSAGDDAIHADRILTVGENGSGPSITVKTCTEGIEATVVNLAGGTVSVTSTDDGVNAANSDGTYAAELAYSINVTGASVTVSAPRADGFDSNGNINLVSGSATISSASTGGDAGLDYDGQLYISDEFTLNNASGVTSMGGGMMGGQMGGQMGQMGGMQQGGMQQGGMQQGGTQQGGTQQGGTQQEQSAAQGQQGMTPGQSMGQSPMQGQQGMTPGQSMGQSPMQGQQGMTPGQSMGQSPMQGQQGMTPGQSMGQSPMQGQQGMTPGQSMGQSPMQGQFGAPNQGQTQGGLWNVFRMLMR